MDWEIKHKNKPLKFNVLLVHENFCFEYNLLYGTFTSVKYCYIPLWISCLLSECDVKPRMRLMAQTSSLLAYNWLLDYDERNVLCSSQ